jgi:hypothetical protein
MSKKSTEPKTSTPPATAQADPIQVALTMDERDAIDCAKNRIRRLATLAAHVLDHDDELLADDSSPLGPALADVLDLVVEDIGTIDATLAAADTRQRALTISGGGQ